MKYIKNAPLFNKILFFFLVVDYIAASSTNLIEILALAMIHSVCVYGVIKVFKLVSSPSSLRSEDDFMKGSDPEDNRHSIELDHSSLKI